ncbi:hypothetical protein C8J57DRAFT_1282265 [Mycena rebaudengoi]|nr:hypothetical protein C8J57DRAFT_1282265 [Mycena rebaudengoi]
MGPIRTQKATRKTQQPSSSAAAGPSKLKTKRTNPNPAQESNCSTGGAEDQGFSDASWKDSLAADVRVETERRLKALEADLEHAQLSKKERALAVRYHKAKFFERQKVTRKISQTKKKIAAGDTPQLQSALHELRVDLNYILHYPKTKKYISLFPPELRKGEEAEPSVDAGREEVRDWVRAQMESGELSTEPELNLDSRSSGGSGGVDWGEQKKPSRGSKAVASASPDMEVDAEDAFFGDDDEEDENDS